MKDLGYCSVCKGLDDASCDCEHCNGTGKEPCSHEHTEDFGDLDHMHIVCVDCGYNGTEETQAMLNSRFNDDKPY